MAAKSRRDKVEEIMNTGNDSREFDRLIDIQHPELQTLVVNGTKLGSPDEIRRAFPAASHTIILP